MKLYLMRHGHAEDRAAAGRDGDRALTAAGRERVLAVAEKLLEAGEAPRSIFSSPLVRAVQTAEILAVAVHAKTGGGGALEIRRELAPGGDAASLARNLAEARKKRVMLVGHEPDLSVAIEKLTGGFDLSFAKAMVVGVRLPPGGARPGRLRFVLEPAAVELVEPGRRLSPSKAASTGRKPFSSG